MSEWKMVLIRGRNFMVCGVKAEAMAAASQAAYVKGEGTVALEYQDKAVAASQAAAKEGWKDD
jgi:hypothetical protein